MVHTDKTVEAGIHNSDCEHRLELKFSQFREFRRIKTLIAISIHKSNNFVWLAYK